MRPTYGGETPTLKYGLEITVEAPDGTSVDDPVEQGDLFKLGGTDSDGSGYKLSELAAGDDPGEVVMVMALHRMTQVREMGVKVLGNWHQIRRLRYVDGAAPTLGQSIQAAAGAGNQRKIAGQGFDGSSYVLAINSGALDAEVLV